MNNSFINQNLNNLKSGTLDWITIQSEMKKKLGVDIYESWLKKLTLLKNLIITFCYLFQQDLFETGLHQGIWIRFCRL